MIVKTDLDFLYAVTAELNRTRKVFPNTEAAGYALMEEVGELARAMMFECPSRIFEEAVQVATLALRIAIESDSCLDDFRVRNDGVILQNCPCTECHADRNLRQATALQAV